MMIIARVISWHEFGSYRPRNLAQSLTSLTHERDHQFADSVKLIYN